jgi:hypothetical protein
MFWKAENSQSLVIFLRSWIILVLTTVIYMSNQYNDLFNVYAKYWI